MTNCLKKLLIPFVAIFITSCGSYDKLLKSRDYDAMYNAALEYYEQGKNSKTIALMDEVRQIFYGTTKSDTIDFYVAKSYYNQRDYIQSASLFDAFRKNYSSSPFAEEAEFLYALSYYTDAPNYELDQAPTILAINAFDEYTSRHPDSQRADTIATLITDLEGRLYDKSYSIGETYYNIGAYNSAITAFKNSLRQYPNTPHREENLFYTVKAHYLFAVNSIESKQRERYYNTMDAAYTFISEFKDSKHIKEVNRIMSNAEKLSKGEVIIAAVGEEVKLTQREILKGATYQEKLYEKVAKGDMTEEEAKAENAKYIEKLKAKAVRRSRRTGNNSNVIVSSALKGQNQVEVDGDGKINRLDVEKIKSRNAEKE